jgi:hypothetical protein
MIVKRQWIKTEGRKSTLGTGYFLLGIIPLYLDYHNVLIFYLLNFPYRKYDIINW